MKNKKLWWWIAGALVVLILLTVMVTQSSDDGIKVAVEAATEQTIIETVTASGKIYPETEVAISPEVSGEIIALPIKEGDTVRQGDLLLKINPVIYSSMVNQAEAAVQQSRAGVSNSQEMVKQMKAQYELAKLNYDRNQTLHREKVISTLELEQSESNYKTAKASYEAALANVQGGQYGVKGAAANLSQAEANLRKTIISAPTTGVVSALHVKLGERVVGTAQMAGTNLLTIADLSRIEVRVDVSETDIAKVKLGDTTLIEADAYRSTPFTGVVSKIAVSSTGTGSALQSANTDQVTNYTVHILILPQSYSSLLDNNKKFPFKPGMSASVEIQTRKVRQTLSVPVNAVTTRDYPDSVKSHKEDKNRAVRQVVFVYDEANKKVVLRDIKTGLQDNQFIQITDGLKKGEKVVVAPYGAIARLLKEGTVVSVTSKEKLYEKKEEQP